MEFVESFKEATGNEPFDHQKRLAFCEVIPQLIDVPTGGGKSALIALLWVWRRRFVEDKTRDETPRRLVCCLSMRALVELMQGRQIRRSSA